MIQSISILYVNLLIYDIAIILVIEVEWNNGKRCSSGEVSVFQLHEFNSRSLEYSKIVWVYIT